MSRADVIYGVTMQEFGVSKPIGVRMTREETSPARQEPLALEPEALEEQPGEAPKRSSIMRHITDAGRTGHMPERW